MWCKWGIETVKEKQPPRHASRKANAAHAPPAGAGSANGVAAADAKNRPAPVKIFAQKKRRISCNFTEQDVERQAERAWIERLLEEPEIDEIGRETVFDHLSDVESCRDLAGK